MILVNGAASSTLHNAGAWFYRIGTMNRQIHGAVSSSSKPISLKTQHPLSDSTSEPANGASGSETRVYTRKKRLKQEPLEKGINAHKQLCCLSDIEEFAYSKNIGSPSSDMKSRWQNALETRQAILQRHSTKADENSELIPIDLLIEIFSRLPVKSMARCRCVSKLWASILRLTYFTELYLTKSSARPRLLFACQKHSELFFFSTPQPQNPDESSSPLTATYHMKIPFDGLDNIISPMSGLVFIRYEHIVKGRKNPQLVSAIFNPSTGQSLTLPKPKTRKRIWDRSYFGYDPTEKQFKVLAMTVGDGIYKEHYVLTLGSEKLYWRMIECCIPHVYGFKGTCINGVLYYPAETDKFSGNSIIVSFDVRSEKFSFIKILEPFIRAVHTTATLIRYNGKLGSLVWARPDYLNGNFFEMWVLGDPGKHEWSKHIYELPPLWQKVLAKELLVFAGLTGTNEVVLSPRFPSHPLYVFYYNLERKTIRRVEIQGMIAFKGTNDNYIFLDHVEDVKLI